MHKYFYCAKCYLCNLSTNQIPHRLIPAGGQGPAAIDPVHVALRLRCLHLAHLLPPDQHKAQGDAGLGGLDALVAGGDVGRIFGEVLDGEAVMDEAHDDVGDGMHKPVLRRRRAVFRPADVI